jgi:ABC-2 type transport system ATP-binding protein
MSAVASPNAEPSPAVQTAAPLMVDSLVKRFGAVTAVDGVSLELGVGECFGLLGPNGAGKSTLIRTIAGRVLPDAGRVAVFGSPAGSPAARAALGWIPQDLAIYPRLSARENLRSFGRYNGIRGKALDESVDWCLQWAALEDRAASLTRTLSGGMKRRLNMAAGLIHHPSLVLMDEPTVGVDPQSRNRIFEMIEALRSKGMTIIYTTHYMEEAERLCDRIAIVDHGKLVALDTPMALKASVLGTNVVEAQFTHESDEWPARLKQLAGVTAVESHGSAMYKLLTADGSLTTTQLVEMAVSRGEVIKSLSVQTTTLDDVFVHYTGRQLRDEQVKAVGFMMPPRPGMQP